MSNIKEIKVDYSSYEIVPDKLYDRFDQHIIYPPTNLSADDTLVTESNLTGYPSSTNYRGLSLAGDTPFVYIPNADSSTTGLMPYSQFNRLTAAYDAAVANPRVRSYTNISNSGMTLDCINIFDLWTTTRGSYSYARIALGEFSNYGSTNDSNCYSLLISGVVGYWGADSRMTFQGSIGTRSVYKLTATRAGTNLTGSI